MKALVRFGFDVLRAGAIAGALLTAFAATASAAPISYTLTVAGLPTGLTGHVDLSYAAAAQVNPAATATITSFNVYDGSLGTATSGGDVTGALPGAVTFGDSPGFNYVSQALTYGNTLSFVLTVDGDTQSSFSVGFFLDPINSFPAPENGSLLLTFDATGLVSSIVIPGPNGEPAPPFSIEQTTAVPEPATMVLLSTGLLGLIARRRK